MGTIIAGFLVGATIAEVARWVWNSGGRIEAAIISVIALASYALLMS